MNKYTFSLKIFTNFENYVYDDYIIDFEDLICDNQRGEDYIEEIICDALHNNKTIVLKNKDDRVIIFNIEPTYIFKIYNITKEQNNDK